MSKTSETGPRKLDKDAYADLKEQTKQEHLSTVDHVDSYSPSNAWRKQAQDDHQQEPAVSYKMEEKKMSKHAKRRAKKKMVVTNQGHEQ